MRSRANLPFAKLPGSVAIGGGVWPIAVTRNVCIWYLGADYRGVGTAIFEIRTRIVLACINALWNAIPSKTFFVKNGVSFGDIVSDVCGDQADGDERETLDELDHGRLLGKVKQPGWRGVRRSGETFSLILSGH